MASGRGSFGNRFTVIMAMAGSAIGLGNIWRFPFMVGQNGGAAFVIIYLLAALFLCIPIFLSESVIGRRTQLSTFGAMDKLAPGTKWKWLGFFTVFTPLIIFSFYSVIGGWSIEYLFKEIAYPFDASQMSRSEHSEAFTDFISDPWAPVFYLTAFMLLNLVIVSAGIQKGIEKFTKITTPILFLLVVEIMIYSLSLPGSSEGVRYMVEPDFSKLKPSSILAALGQAFFSLSLGVGCILTYASYVKKEENILTTGVSTAIFDLVFALISGFAVMPAVFAAGIEPGAGPALIFETLPFIFQSMRETMPLVSDIVSILFFLTILFAALTSSVSMLETGVAYLVDEKKMGRKKATAILFVGCWVLSILCSLSFGPLADVKIFGRTIFDFCDFITSDFLMTFGSLLFVLFVGWKMKKSEVRDEFTNGGKLRFNDRVFGVFLFLVRFVAPIVIATVFVTSLF